MNLMKEPDTLKKILTIFVLLVIIGVATYILFFKAEEPELIFDDSGNLVTAQVVGADLIALLEELQSVRFDSSFFRSPAFTGLSDYSIDLGVQPQGRNNPFDAIGR